MKNHTKQSMRADSIAFYAKKGRAEKRAVAALLAALVSVLAVTAARFAVRAPEAPSASDAATVGAQLVTAAWNGAAATKEPVQVRARRAYCYNILLSGVDDAGGGSDTNLLLRFDAANRQMDLVSLPRDTLLHHEWPSNKLNYAYALGGSERLASEIESLLGVPVDYTVSVDLRGFVSLVDRIGGVDFDVPVRMDYDDPAQELHIHLAPGLQHLNGQQAMGVVRFRKNNDGSGYPDADIGRIRTQQAFLKALAQKAVSLENAPALAQLASSYVKTDLSLGNLVWLGSEALRIGAEGAVFRTLPGDGAGYYRGESVYVLDPEATLALVNEALNPYDAPISAEELDILVP